jgi:hypothetical protein
MNRLIVALAILCFLIQARIAAATPVVLLREDFAALQTGRSTIIEDFQGFLEIGPQAPTIHLNNGTYSSPTPFISQAVDGSRLLFDECCPREFATFSDFPSGTIAWSAGISTLLFTERHYDITVVGGSGTLDFDHYSDTQFFPFPPQYPGFVAFYDPQGLVSVSIRIEEVWSTYN